ncbi:MAG: hypothetical protein IJ728_08520 [Selenomonadaceae bacterium]|nr:hypothetical protein [Selenomonadaceae bacterium]
MKLKKLIAVLTAGIISLTSMAASAAENPTCILMKFTDDTRFAKIESAASLSDLVMEKLLASGQFNFKETKVINADMENMLYEERAAEFKNAKIAIDSGNYNVLFEGPGYNQEKAQTIATAQVGQFVSPQITSAIGKQHGADYLIQGTIINIGTGDWLDMSVANAMSYAQYAMMLPGLGTAIGSTLAALGPIGMVAGLALNVQTKVTGVGIQADLRLIKAETGEVVWSKMVTGKETQKQRSLAFIKVGSDKLNNEMYADAMDNAAEVIANAIIEDIGSGKLFLENDKQ